MKKYVFYIRIKRVGSEFEMLP
jgi:hypothetical protein